jgi:hypothetical protein
MRVFGASGPPHFLPKYIPDKLLARDITYQMMEKGATAHLSEKNKIYWPIFPLHIGQYFLMNKKHTGKGG